MVIGKVKYIGKSFGVEGLTNGKIYDVLEIDRPFLRIIDDSDEDYLYSISKPSDLQNLDLCGKWELVESYDDELTRLFSDSRK